MMFRFASIALSLALATSALTPALAQHQAAPAMAAATGAEVSAGDLTISGGFTRATLPGAPVAGGFLTITNSGTEDDRLVGVTTSIAKEAQIHEMALENEIMKMRRLEDGLVIPAGETVTLAPGGYHLMFMGLTGGISEGDAVAVTLTFERAGDVAIDLVAGPADAKKSH
jgi:copper(I)-binding protein